MALRRSPAARMHRAGRQRRGGRDVAEPRPVALLSLGCSPLQREVPHCTQPRARPWRHRAVWAAPAARTCRYGRAGLYRRLLATAVPTQACPRVVLTVAASVAWPTLRLPPAWREVIDAAVTTRQRSPSSSQLLPPKTPGTVETNVGAGPGAGRANGAGPAAAAAASIGAAA